MIFHLADLAWEEINLQFIGNYGKGQRMSGM
jgi:hypothetical protein